MDSLDADDQLTIVNRSTEYRISKKLICKIPYFERMLSHECLESKENKVELDFDEQAFASFLHWIEFNNVKIDMSYVISLCNISDYFEMNSLVQRCTQYLRNRFFFRDLPTVIPQVTKTSMLINSDNLNAFFCCHFLKIANTTVWTSYSVETIEFICALDLMIYSEVQVFEAITRWVDFNADSRKCHFARLLRLVRWCYLERKDLSKIEENTMYKSSGFEPKSCLSSKRDCDCFFDRAKQLRAKQHCFVIIEELKGTDLQIMVLDYNFICLFNRDLTLDESISSSLLHDEHISDIFYHSGGKAIRVDWIRNKYRFFNEDDFRSYLMGTCELRVSSKYLNNNPIKYWKKPRFYPFYLCTIRNETSLIGTYGHEEFEYWSTKLMQTADESMDDSRLHGSVIRLRVTVLSDNIFILTNNLEFGKFNVRNKHFKKIELPKLEQGYKFEYKNLLLTSTVGHTDLVFLIDQSAYKVFCFIIKKEKWIFVGRLLQDLYIYKDSKGGHHYWCNGSDKLITLTPALLPLNMISTCTNHNLK